MHARDQTIRHARRIWLSNRWTVSVLLQVSVKKKAGEQGRMFEFLCSNVQWRMRIIPAYCFHLSCLSQQHKKFWLMMMSTLFLGNLWWFFHSSFRELPVSSTMCTLSLTHYWYLVVRGCNLSWNRKISTLKNYSRVSDSDKMLDAFINRRRTLTFVYAIRSGL